MAMSSMAPPAAPRGSDGDGDGAVCCMCGDRGLPHELLRCRFCRIRLQHRYCSDLYPRATAYRRCNWCLREPADGRGANANANGHAHAHPHAVVGNKPTEKRIKVVAPSTETSTLDEEERRQSRQPQQAGCSAMSRAAPELGRPIKKQKAEERPTALPPPPPAPGAAKAGSSSNSKKPPTQAAGKMARPGRVKVRRYKLLAEVIISC